jgi:5-methylcytosine-specific restriction protein A
VSIRDLTDPNAVHVAMAEFDRVGREAFLANHGYGPARRYFLQSSGGKLYDSKAVAGVAYGYQFPDQGPLKSGEFSGGEATVKAQLETLGFEVVRSQSDGDALIPRNPPWIRDELILALNLYMRLADRGFAHDSREILECSQLLNQLQLLMGTTRSETLRNPNGVYMKLMNFRRLDSTFTAAGRRGLSRGNKLEEEVWSTFHSNTSRLTSVAAAIQKQITAVHSDGESGYPWTGDTNEDLEAPEGRILTRLHRQRERNQALVAAKKQRALGAAGHLSCEVCEFDFVATYGERGQGFMECHHIKPVETLPEEGRTRLTDLALICSNCHRMIHARRPWISVKQLRTIFFGR